MKALVEDEDGPWNYCKDIPLSIVLVFVSSIAVRGA